MKRRNSKSGNPIRIGFVPLVDCAPLAIADTDGFFEDEGLDVELIREPGWASIREKIAFGEMEAAHALVGLCFGISWGIGVVARPCVAGFLFNSNGDAITMSRRLADKGIASASDLFEYINCGKSEKLTFAVPHLLSSHHFLLRQWLQPAGIRPDIDIDIKVVPPSLVVSCLESELIDGYCVGEPFNSLAVSNGSGVVIKESAEISPMHPEKALLVTKDFSIEHEEQHLGMIRALSRAAEICDTTEGRERAAEILSGKEYLNLDASVIRKSLVPEDSAFSSTDFHTFHQFEVNKPTAERANWVVSHMRQAGLIEPGSSGLSVSSIFREDIYIKALGLEEAKPVKKKVKNRSASVISRTQEISTKI